MNIIKIEKNNQVNGAGLRCIIWCAGCNHNCPGCHNPEAQNPTLGHSYNTEHWNKICAQLDKPEISGVTFSGGEATYPPNREEATALMKRIKTSYPTKTIWLYSGYLYEDICNLPMMEYVDVLVDGPYIAALNPGIGKLKWRGSSNQRVIDVQASRSAQQVVEYKDFNGQSISDNERG